MLLDIIQVILAIILITTILLQNQGAGLGAAFGGEGNAYRTKRGPEKILFIITIVVSILFLIIALTNVIF
ncbi:MAG: preprotein translocase subunit SecG [Candidatus Buchananbacteria bacterium]|nr:preprotein translocase subunit SecG [Candidatus Buchananbacteria bacterium]